MRKSIYFAAIIIIMGLAAVWLINYGAAPKTGGAAGGKTSTGQDGQTNMQKEEDIQHGEMRLTSPLFTHNGNFPIGSTCDGKENNPPLEIEMVPEEAKSLALILSDPDAPSGMYYHWVVWNIDPKTKSIMADAVPGGAVQGVNSGRQNIYFGPCPPSGTHRYYFDLYALDVLLNLPEATSGPQLKAAMEGHIISRAQLMARYR